MSRLSDDVKPMMVPNSKISRPGDLYVSALVGELTLRCAVCYNH